MRNKKQLAVITSTTAGSDKPGPAKLVQRKVRVTAGMDAEVMAYGRAEGKADMAEAYRSIIGRGLRQYKAERGQGRPPSSPADIPMRAGSASLGGKLWTTGH